MNYTLNKKTSGAEKSSFKSAAKAMLPLLRPEAWQLVLAFLAILVNALLLLIAPRVIGHAVDTYIQQRNYHGVLVSSGWLLAIYVGAMGFGYLQTTVMGGVGQRVLFALRNRVFTKLQSLPVAFFNQNKAGDLISRINNDTDKLNQFFSQTLMQFIGSAFTMIGAGIFLVSIHHRLGFAALAPAALLLVLTQALSPWIKSKNSTSLKSLGSLSSEIQESLNNFKVIIAFNRRDYFREKFQKANEENYQASIGAGIANNVFVPLYGLSSHIAQLIILAYGISLIASGSFTIGLLVSFLAYANNFYMPLRQLASLWANFQVALAGWDRIAEILAMESDLPLIEAHAEQTSGLLEFRDVSFGYPDGKEVLRDIHFTLEKGKTYALVGPTGGGKTTTASLMARLFDPTRGMVLLNGKDIRSYTDEQRTQRIGFILQEPFLFNGTVQDNLVYGNTAYQSLSRDQMLEVLKQHELDGLLVRFDQGLETPVLSTGDSISLGQRQLIAFMRAILRKPDLLILDEATANIDTVTEQLLEDVLKKLPKETTRVIIAHRLNTIESADEIFFVNGASVARAGSLEHAVEMLLQGKKES